MQNIVFIPAINNAPDNIDYYEWCLESWRSWCHGKDIQIVVMDEPVVEVSMMKPTWQRWYVLDLLENNGITDYENVLLVDGDTLIHPYAPNIFDYVKSVNNTLEKPSFYAVNDDLMVEWIFRSIEGYSHFWPEVKLNWTRYFNCGLVMIHKNQKDILNEALEFYWSNRTVLQEMQHKTLRKGSDQTPINYIFNKSPFEVNFLDRRWNCTHMHLRGFFDQSDGHSIFEKLGYVYHFNGFEKSRRNELMRQFWYQYLKPLN